MNEKDEREAENVFDDVEFKQALLQVFNFYAGQNLK